MRNKLTLLPLTLLMISAVDSNRNLPSTALFGGSLVFYFLFAAIFFFFPTALVSAELGSSHHKKEGIYDWVRHALGEKWGMLAIWLQWVNTVVFFPTILTFIAGALAYVIDPALINSKLYMLITISVIFWLLTLLNLRGLHISARANTLLTLGGTLIPVFFLMALGLVWLLKGEPLQISLSLSSITPEIGKFDSWVALVAVTASLLGMELTAVHIGEVRDPQTVFPRALGIATFAILFTMLFGALTIATVLPVGEINLAGGIMQVFEAFFRSFGLEALIPVMTFLIVFGSAGGLINWMISPSKGLLFAANHGFLPPRFTRLNKQGMASHILITQAIIVTLLTSLLLFLPTVNGFYWFLTALSTGLYMLMYGLMFVSALILRKQMDVSHGHFVIPGGRPALLLCCFSGLFGCAITFFFGFVPPTHVNVGSPLGYVLMIAGGMLFFVCPIFLVFLYKSRKHKTIT
jgi:amino acid transporter